MSEKICPICGTKIPEEATKCYSCKSNIEDVALEEEYIENYREDDDTNVVCETENLDSKPVEFLPTLLFAYFLGGFGIHRFYTGHTVLGIIQLLTLGGCGLWSFIDYILICFDKFEDEQGRKLRKYDKNIGIVAFIIGLLPIFLIFLFFVLGLIIAIVAASSS